MIIKEKMKKFKELGITDEILDAIKDLGFKEPTDIQKDTIPLTLEGKDIIAGSATGSGKTLAFGASIIQNCIRGKGIQALILTPTRELAEQITQSLGSFSRYKRLSIVPIYGGVSLNPQFEKLHSADIVVGTPGRMLDHLQRDTIDLSAVKILVLDEADRMLDMGFLPDVKKIIGQCPKQKQVMLFSATIPPEIKNLSEKFMNDPQRVSVECFVDPRKLSQVYYDVPNNLKFSLLTHLIKHEETNLVMVFCNSRVTVDYVTKGLKKYGIDAIAIHGGLTQQKRTQTIDRFNSKNATFVLVCTDVAARGLDIPGVTHVYNYDIPSESKQYIHRIGRTARAGESGKAINLLSPRDHDNFNNVLRDNSIEIPKAEKPYIEKLDYSGQTSRRPGRSDSSRQHGRQQTRSGSLRDRDRRERTSQERQGQRSGKAAGSSSQSSQKRQGQRRSPRRHQQRS